MVQGKGEVDPHTCEADTRRDKGGVSKERSSGIGEMGPKHSADVNNVMH